MDILIIGYIMICIVRNNFGWFSLLAGLFMAACAAINKEGTLFALYCFIALFYSLVGIHQFANRIYREVGAETVGGCVFAIVDELCHGCLGYVEAGVGGGIIYIYIVPSSSFIQPLENTTLDTSPILSLHLGARK